MLDQLSSYLTDTDLWAFLVAVPFIVIGFVGSVLPVLPGAVIILAGFLVFGFMTGFTDLGLVFFIGQFFLMSLSYLVDFIASAFGVKLYGGSRAAIWGAVAGTLMIFVVGPVGLLLGPLLGAVAGELLAGAEINQSLKAGVGTMVGFVAGSMAKIVVCSLMIGWFIWEII